MLGLCCWAHPWLALMPFGEPSCRQKRIKTSRDLSIAYCSHGLFSLKQTCSCSSTGTTWSHKITVPMKSWCTREKKINLLLFSSLTTSFLHFSSWFIFMFSDINFPGQCYIPWLCDLYIPADICREMRGDKVQINPSCWHFYLSIFFPHLPLLSCLCVCVKEG